MLSWIGLGSPTTVFVSLENEAGSALSLDINLPGSPSTTVQESELLSPFFKRHSDPTHLPRVYPMNLLRLDSRNISMSFSLPKKRNKVFIKYNLKVFIKRVKVHKTQTV